MTTRTVEDIEADIAAKKAEYRSLQVDDGAPPEPPEVTEAYDQVAYHVKRELVALSNELLRAKHECPCCGQPAPEDKWDERRMELFM